MNDEYKEGTRVHPENRLSQNQVEIIHKATLSLLKDPGITCTNQKAVQLYKNAGCSVSQGEGEKTWQVRFPENLVEQTLKKVPPKVVLGARNPANRLVLDARVPRLYFGTGSETNIYLSADMDEFQSQKYPSRTLSYPVFSQERGSVRHLCQSAKLCNSLSNIDFFIRNVNIQDEDITPENKDVNVFMASLMYMTKHVQAGLVREERLEDVIKLAQMVAGGPEQFRENPIISFITCVIKSPLQMLKDTTSKLISIAQKGIPVVLSSSPQGGSTAPIQEEGMVAQINAEILAGIILAQIVNPGTPVLYGAVPVRARLDTLHDFYGIPEFIHYNMDCIQMARHYGIPCYSSAGVGDAKVPGLQATIDKVFSQLRVASAGPPYIHYSVGLLDKTNIFCPLQAVLDEAQIGMIRGILRQPSFDQEDQEEMLKDIRKVLGSKMKLFAKQIRKARRKGLISPPYPFESHESEDKVFLKAYQKLQEILSGSDERLDEDIIDAVYNQVPGILPKERFEVQ